jgi:hypothetical protein|tara:strand:+ start:138 stop:641 length:504 start_codon:yes stop_codon:yes gene_type:complete
MTEKKKKSLARRIIEAEQRNMPMNRADLDKSGFLETKEESDLLDKIRAGMYGDPKKFPKTFLNKLQQEDKKQDRIGADYANIVGMEREGKDPNELMRSRRFNIDPRAIEPGMGGLTPGRGMAQYYQGELDYEGPEAGRGTLVRGFKQGRKVRGAGIARKGVRKCKMV